MTDINEARDMRDHLFAIKVFVPSDVTCTEDRIKWYLDHAIRGYHRDFALETDPIRKMSQCSVMVEKVAFSDIQKERNERDAALTASQEQQQTIEKLTKVSAPLFFAIECADGLNKNGGKDGKSVKVKDCILDIELRDLANALRQALPPVHGGGE